MRWLDSMTASMDMSLSKLWKILEDRGSWHATVHGVAKSWIQLSDGTTTAIYICICIYVYIYMHMGCSSPGSSVHGILQARILE